MSSQYALGVAGIAFNFNVINNFELTAAAGYGFTPNQKVSFAGANLMGDVSGTYTGLGAKIKIYENSRGQLRKLFSREFYGEVYPNRDVSVQPVHIL